MVKGEFAGCRQKSLSIDFIDFQVGFFEDSCKRVHDKVLWSLKSSARSALLNSTECQTSTCQEGAPAEVIDLGRSLNVAKYLGGETV
jgi:hypothetical protein